MLVGYARVSSDGQDTALQLRALRRAGAGRVFEETKSGGTLARPELARMLASLRPGDEVAVYKVDRLARSLFDLLGILREVQTRGAGFRSLTEPVETATPMGRAMLQMLGVWAELELSMIRERCEAGRVAALARGVRIGRPRLLDYREVQTLRAAGLTWRAIGAQLGCDESSARWALRRVDRGEAALDWRARPPRFARVGK